MSEQPKRVINAASTPVDLDNVRLHLAQQVKDGKIQPIDLMPHRVPEMTPEAAALMLKNSRPGKGTSYSKTPQELGMVQRISPEGVKAHFSQGKKAAKRAAKALLEEAKRRKK